MNSLTVVLLLIIAIIGIGSIVWVKKYYKEIETEMPTNGLNTTKYINKLKNQKNKLPETEDISSMFNFNKKEEKIDSYQQTQNIENDDSLTDSFKNMFTGENNNNKKEYSAKDLVKDTIGEPTTDFKNKISEFNDNLIKNSNDKPASLKKGSKSTYNEVETITPLKEEEKEKFKIEDPIVKTSLKINNDDNQNTLTQPEKETKPKLEENKNTIPEEETKPKLEENKNLEEDEKEDSKESLNSTNLLNETDKPETIMDKAVSSVSSVPMSDKQLELINQTSTKPTEENKKHHAQKRITEEGVVVLDESDRKDNVTLEEILKDKSYNQPNENVDEIYEEINNIPYNHTEVEDDIGKSFEGLDDASYQTDEEEEFITPIYAEKRQKEEAGEEIGDIEEYPEDEDFNETLTPYENFVHRDTDQKKIENASQHIDKFYEKLSEFNLSNISKKTKKVYSEGSNKIQENIKNNKKHEKTEKDKKIELSNDELPNLEVPYEINHISKLRTPPKTTAKTTPKTDSNNIKSNTPETIKVNGTPIELKRGETVIFNHNGETYSSTILKTKPGQIYVTYRKHRIWISTGSVKKKF
ncbi:hypothetical protein [Methanobrevibacter sp. UBA46]|jgi:hypothetical protein|uniref:hypothetical protein n=3 Tax=Methanobrevibacter TaxID=2172 RepID=UPI0039B9C26B